MYLSLFYLSILFIFLSTYLSRRQTVRRLTEAGRASFSINLSIAYLSIYLYAGWLIGSCAPAGWLVSSLTRDVYSSAY